MSKFKDYLLGREEAGEQDVFIDIEDVVEPGCDDDNDLPEYIETDEEPF